ncbi:hypothetical protein, partial [Sphingomonas aquatilis]|uniref:hypothetical protein n=1 Tax=Sphingomonas aquatilis TaxID=93063 RepID=UPI001ABF0C54
MASITRNSPRCTRISVSNRDISPVLIVITVIVRLPPKMEVTMTPEACRRGYRLTSKLQESLISTLRL